MASTESVLRGELAMASNPFASLSDHYPESEARADWTGGEKSTRLLPWSPGCAPTQRVTAQTL